MPTDPAEPVLVGIVARAHGLRGEVVVDPTTDTPGRFDPGRTLAAVLPSGAARSLRIATSRPFQHRWLVCFEGVESRTDAEALHSAELTIRRDQVAPLPEGRFYRFELIGLTARTPQGMTLGRVEEVFATGSNDVLVVRGEGGEVLIPLLDTVLLSVDVAGGTIVLAPPLGLPGLPGEE